MKANNEVIIERGPLSLLRTPRSRMSVERICSTASRTKGRPKDERDRDWQSDHLSIGHMLKTLQLKLFSKDSLLNSFACKTAYGRLEDSRIKLLKKLYYNKLIKLHNIELW